MNDKKRVFDNSVRILLSAALIALHTGGFYYVLFYKYNRILLAPLDSGGYLMVALYCVGLVGVCNIMGAFKVGYNKQFNIILSHVISLVIVNSLAYFQLSLVHRGFLPLHQMTLLSLGQLCVSVLWTLVVFVIVKKCVPITDMLLVYGDKKAEELVYKILEREDQYRIRETILFSPGTALTDSNLEQIKERIRKYSAVIVCRLESSVRNDLLKFCYENDIVVYLPPRISDIIVRGAGDLNQFDSPLIVCRNCSLTESQLFFKRLCDIVISLLGIIIASPIMLIAALAIKIYDGGPIIYKQKRVTLNERIFDIYKFRSMVQNAERDNKSIPATDHDPRITPVGRILRKLRLDELPQLFNILVGDMSFVGPRPERVEHHEAYTRQIPEFPYRTKVKAGLTGYAQVMGKYNTSPYDKLLLDLTYIQRFSFFLDFKLILLTIKVMFMDESTEGFKEKKKEGDEK